MFKTLIRGACLSAALAAGGTAMTTAPAAANGISFGITIGEGGRYHGGPRYDDRRPIRDDGFCAPRRALREASRLGVRRPYIAHETRRSIIVASARNGAEVRFAQRRDCPIISYRR